MSRYFKEEQIYVSTIIWVRKPAKPAGLAFCQCDVRALWNNKYIESVQLTIAEQLGVEERGEFYDYRRVAR